MLDRTLKSNYLLFLRLLTMDCRDIYFVVFGLSLLTLQCTLTQSLCRPSRTVYRVYGYPSFLPVPHTGYPSTLPLPHTGYPSTLPLPHTGYPSTLPVVHTGYPSTLPVAHTGYPSTLPLSHTDSTRFVCLCYTREKQLSLNNAAIKPSSADVNTVQTVSLLLPMSVPFRPCLLIPLPRHGYHRRTGLPRCVNGCMTTASIAVSCCSACHADRRRGDRTAPDEEHEEEEGFQFSLPPPTADRHR